MEFNPKYSKICLYAGLVAVFVAVIIALVTIGVAISVHNESMQDNEPDIRKELFGFSKTGEAIDKYRLTNRNGLQVDIITLGGTITSIRVPDVTGRRIDVVLGFDTIAEYESGDNPYFGCLVGRVANRIKHGRFTLGCETFQVTLNDGLNHLHGGVTGWNKAIWQARIVKNSLELSHTSSDGDQGYPGEVEVVATFNLTSDNQLKLQFRATTKGKATPINLTTHPYFNLAGEGSENIYDHILTINSDKYVPVDRDLIPIGFLYNVTGGLDFRKPRLLRDVMQMAGNEYDLNYCIPGASGMHFMARLEHPPSGRVLEVSSDQPGLQLYTTNTPLLVPGKQGHIYGKHSALCLEPQNYPDAINHNIFPDSVLYPDGVYIHNMAYKFSTV